MLSPAHNKQGSVLVTGVVLISIAAFTSVMLSSTMLDHRNHNLRRRELWKAFNVAEAGIAQVQQWGLYPGEYAPDSGLFTYVPKVDDPNSESGLVSIVQSFEEAYPNLYAAIHGASDGVVVNEESLQAMDVGHFESSHSEEIGTLVEVKLLAPEAGDPVACDFKIESTGRSFRGLERNVLGYATLNPVMGLKIPAALISFQNAATNGNVKIHWGEAWSKHNMRMESMNQYGYLSTDPKAIWRTEGLINQWGGGWRVDTATNPDVLTTQNDMGVAISYIGRFFQNQATSDFPAPWPQFDYQTFKDLAKSHGRYFSTDASGNIYRDGVETPSNQIDFLAEFGIGNQNSAVYDLVFIDTIDGNPPSADSSNLSTISISGNSLGIKGVFYVGANFSAAGIGSPPGLSVENPYTSASTALDKIFLNGVLYAAGTLDMSGNAGVYGSVITQKGFVGSGTPDVYYNQELANGMILGNGNVGSPFRVIVQTNY